MSKETWYLIQSSYSGKGYGFKIIPMTVLTYTEKTVTIERVYKNWNGEEITQSRRMKIDRDVHRTLPEVRAEITKRLTDAIKRGVEELHRAEGAYEIWKYELSKEGVA